MALYATHKNQAHGKALTLARKKQRKLKKIDAAASERALQRLITR